MALAGIASRDVQCTAMIVLDKILVATDFSDPSSQALRFAVVLARQYRAHIVLAHLFTGVDEFGRADASASAYRAEREAAERAVAEILASGAMEGISHEVLLEAGFFWETLDYLIRQKEIKLVAIGTSGAQGSERESMGSHAELVFRNAGCPVLTAGPAIARNPRPILDFKRILFATDFGEDARRAAAWACSLARDFRAALTLLHVLGGTGASPQPQSSVLEETTKVRLVEAVPDDISKVCKVDCAVRYGDAAEQIAAFARENDADLIVMGTRSGRPLSTHLPYPTAYTVAVSAPCPLITIRS